MFKLAAEGLGQGAICNALKADGVPPFTAGSRLRNGRHKRPEGGAYTPGGWNASYVGQILRDRRAIGEFQPRSQDGKPDGSPLEGYFPAAVSPAEFYQARAGAACRTKRRHGRVGLGVPNLFQGLLHNARPEGGTYVLCVRLHGDVKTHLLM